MKHEKWWSTLLVGTALVFATGCAKDKDGGGVARSAATPEEAVKYFAEACKAGDMDRLAEQLAEPAREKTKVDLDTEKAHEAFLDALDAKFGKESNPLPRVRLRDIFKTLTNFEVLEKKELDSKDQLELKLELTHKPLNGSAEYTDNATMFAVKEGSAWKVYTPNMRPEQIKDLKRYKESSQKQVDAYKKVTQEVRDGKYADRGKAFEAMFPKEVVPPKPDKP